jgi:hypothetical protein
MSKTSIRRPRAAASTPLPTALGQRLARDLLQRAERVDRQLVEHPVAGQVGDHPADLVGASRPAIRANSATSRATVCVPSIISASCHSSGVSRR